MNRLNRDSKTIAGFGDEWERFDQSRLDAKECRLLFDKYFKIFPWQLVSKKSQGFDMGCGSGRWANLVASNVAVLHCIDPSSALTIAKKNLARHENCIFYQAGVSDGALAKSSMDFGYSLGVLHHVPDTSQAIRDCVDMLKPGAPFLLYLYYAFDNRSYAYRSLWRVSEIIRRIVSNLPHGARYMVSQTIALCVYWPLARFAATLEFFGLPAKKAEVLPLGFYRHLSFYTMRTDALDRFGTSLEKRFTKEQIFSMMQSAGLTDIRFSDDAPYWCAVGIRRV